MKNQATMKSQTFYKTIVFGENRVGIDNHLSFFNEKSTHSTQHAAERFALDRINMAGTLGYVVIKQEHEQWSVVDEMGMSDKYVVEEKWGGVFYVNKSDKVVIHS
jgi:hypothetical protein